MKNDPAPQTTRCDNCGCVTVGEPHEICLAKYPGGDQSWVRHVLCVPCGGRPELATPSVPQTNRRRVPARLFELTSCLLMPAAGWFACMAMHESRMWPSFAYVAAASICFGIGAGFTLGAAADLDNAG